MNFSFDPSTCKSKIVVLQSEKNCLKRALSILHGMAQVKTEGAQAVADSLAALIGKVCPDTRPVPSPEENSQLATAATGDTSAAAVTTANPAATA